jgi:hypothetical protein
MPASLAIAELTSDPGMALQQREISSRTGQEVDRIDERKKLHSSTAGGYRL